MSCERNPNTTLLTTSAVVLGAFVFMVCGAVFTSAHFCLSRSHESGAAHSSQDATPALKRSPYTKFERHLPSYPGAGEE